MKRLCCRPGCGRPAAATLTYAYVDSIAHLGPLSPTDEPHSWDLCEMHADRVTTPQGWELIRTTNNPGELTDEDLTALAEAVAEFGETGLSLSAPGPVDTANVPGSAHPAYGPRRTRTRPHLYVVRD